MYRPACSLADVDVFLDAFLVAGHVAGRAVGCYLPQQGFRGWLEGRSANAPKRPLLPDQSKAITPPASATHFRFGQALAAHARCLLAEAAFLARREGAWCG